MFANAKGTLFFIAILVSMGMSPEPGDATYDQAKDALKERQWERAIELLDDVLERGVAESDGALYWKAFSLNKLERRAEAMAALNVLQETHGDSRWIGDARALSMEIRQRSGQTVSPEETESESLKIMALTGLMNAEPERARPILLRFLEGDHSIRLKKKALFVLAQTGSDPDLIVRIAEGGDYPELRPEAVHLLGVFGGEAASQVLVRTFKESEDEDLKTKALNGLMIAQAGEPLKTLLREETDPSWRAKIIHTLGLAGSAAELETLYRQETDDTQKEAILHALALSRSHEFLLEVARNDPNPELQKSAIQKFGLTGNCSELEKLYSEMTDVPRRKAIIHALLLTGFCDVLQEIAIDETNLELRLAAVQTLGLTGAGQGAFLKKLYAEDEDREIKIAALHALFIQQDSDRLIEIIRSERDPELKRLAIRNLSQIRDDKATAFMLEILEQ